MECLLFCVFFFLICAVFVLLNEFSFGISEVQKEVSLAIIKPDAVKAGLVDEIIAKVSSRIL